MTENMFPFQGLSSIEIENSRLKYGRNILNYKKENTFFDAIKGIFKEPMVILLLAASSIYFISGNFGDGLFLFTAIILVATISLYQDSRSKNALERLKTFSEPHSKVIRNNKIEKILSSELVLGDLLIVEEGSLISADGKIIYSNDFSVNESLLTGESLSVFKDKTHTNNYLYLGTSVSSGLAIIEITDIGNQTKLGKIGKSLEEIVEEKTPLEIQINSFVKKMVLIGLIIFISVWGINYFQSYLILDSLLKALTLAMSILPEEIPVAFTTFMALGAWRLMKLGIIVKQMKTVESLGSASVICTDKTGTLTENKMSLVKLYDMHSKEIVSIDEKIDDYQKKIIENAMWASEPNPFDPMELALHKNYSDLIEQDERPNYKLTFEYPLEGKPPMMTHVFENNMGEKIIVCKGAPEAIIKVSKINDKQKNEINEALSLLTNEGYRVLGVANSIENFEEYPEKQQEINFIFNGLIAFYDPPKSNISSVLESFYTAGIQVKIITGDNTETTQAIAKQLNFKNPEKVISGDELMRLNQVDLEKCVMETSLFTRMFPEAKLKIIKALKSQNQLVAMTGDGVNDGPALKAAHIGIAMGINGSEIAKQAASLILQEDDLSKMVDAIAMGRKIYSNLKKAIQYIISIHIPIILTVFLPLILGWAYPTIFSPIHVIFLELIMGPTCSIIYENEPLEANAMSQKPKELNSSFFSWRELSTSLLQGLIITLGVLVVYQYAVYLNYSEQLIRAMVFSCLIFANIFLTLVNRSFYYSIFDTIKYKNNMVPLIIVSTLFLLVLLLYVKPLTQFFEFESLNFFQLSVCLGIAFISVIWFEIVKFLIRQKS